MNRRVKLVSLSAEMVMRVLFPKPPRVVLEYAAFSDDALPDGYEVEAVRENFESGCFDVLVSHPSFDEAPLGERPPRWPVGGFCVRAFARVEGAVAFPHAQDESGLPIADLPVYREGR